LLILYGAGAGIAPWVLVALITGLLVVLCVLERLALPGARSGRSAAQLGLP
jgi:hypothetical protein